MYEFSEDLSQYLIEGAELNNGLESSFDGISIVIGYALNAFCKPLKPSVMIALIV